MKKINLPTKLTILRILIAFLLIIGIIVFYFLDEFNVIRISDASIYFTHDSSVLLEQNVSINYYFIGILAFFVIACATDSLDGYLARKYNQVTELGKFLDPIADKMLINALMIFLALNFKSMGSYAKFPFFCVIIMIVRDLVVDGLRFMAAKKNVVIAANIFGKLKTVFQMVAIIGVLINGFPLSFLDYNWPVYLHITDWLCYIATFFSVFSGIIYVKQNIKILGGKNDD